MTNEERQRIADAWALKPSKPWRNRRDTVGADAARRGWITRRQHLDLGGPTKLITDPGTGRVRISYSSR